MKVDGDGRVSVSIVATPEFAVCLKKYLNGRIQQIEMHGDNSNRVFNNGDLPGSSQSYINGTVKTIYSSGMTRKTILRRPAPTNAHQKETVFPADGSGTE
jgi:hypothetical protein